MNSTLNNTIKFESFVQAVNDDDGTHVIAIRELLQFFLWTGCTRIQALLSKGRLEFRFDAADGKALMITDYAGGVPFARLFGMGATFYLAQGGGALSMTASGSFCRTEIGFQLGPDAHAVLPVAPQGDDATIKVVNQELACLLGIELARTIASNSTILQVTVTCDGQMHFEARRVTMKRERVSDDTEFLVSGLELRRPFGTETCELRAYQRGKFAITWIPKALSEAVGKELGGLYGPALTCLPLEAPLALKAPFSRMPVESMPNFASGRHAGHNRAQLKALGELLDFALATEGTLTETSEVVRERLNEQLVWYPRAVGNLMAQALPAHVPAETTAPVSIATADIPLQSLRLPGRSLGGFRQMKINTLNEAAALSDELMLAIPGVGPRAVEIIRKAALLKAYGGPSAPLEKDADQSESDSKQDGSPLAGYEPGSWLTTAVKEWLRPLPDPDRKILEMFFGLNGGYRLGFRDIAYELRRPLYVAKSFVSRAQHRIMSEPVPEELRRLLRELVGLHGDVVSLDKLTTEFYRRHGLMTLSAEGLLELLAFVDHEYGITKLKSGKYIHTPKHPPREFFKVRQLISGGDSSKAIDSPAELDGEADTLKGHQTGTIEEGAKVGTAVSYLSFENARDLVREHRFISREAYESWSTSGARPQQVPESPDEWYSESEWTSWEDWLGLVPETKQWRPFAEARAFVRRLAIGSIEAWEAYVAVANTTSLNGIPASPAQAYASSGWQGWGDWLGLNTVGCDPRWLKDELKSLIPRLGTMDRSSAQEELKRLGVWRYPLAGSAESRRILQDLLGLPFVGKRDEACFDLADRIDRALLATTDIDTEWE